MADVQFVMMPMAAVQRPSIALGQLQAALSGARIASQAVFANLMYLDWVGVDLYRRLERSRIEDGLVDWLFAPVAFPDFRPDEEAYLRDFQPRNAEWLDPSALGQLRSLRRQSAGFIDWVADRVLQANPCVVGASSTFQQHVASLAILRRVKDRRPDIVTLMGGANCETRMGQGTHRNFPWVDIVVSGEADGLIADLCCQILDRGEAPNPDVVAAGVFVPGHRDRGYPGVQGGDGVARATTEDMAQVPVPDYADYFTALQDCLHNNLVRPGIPFESARGCWWGVKNHCTFCGLNGSSMAFRAKPAKQTLAELQALSARYATTDLEAVDNILPVDYPETLLADLAADERDWNLFYETKSNLKPAEVEALADAGVRWIQPGVESLHTKVLKLMRKGVAGWANVRLLRLCRQFGIRATWAILAEFPGEEDDWYAEMAGWIPALAHLQPGGVATLRYDRYSPYFNRPEEFGLDLTPSPLYREIYPVEPEELADLVYFFSERSEAEERARRSRNLIRAEGVGRPGLDATTEAMKAWTELWRTGPPVLSITADGDDWIVEDTRPIASEPRYRVTGLAATLLGRSLECPGRAALVRACAAEGRSETEVEAALAQLADRRLVLDIDDRVVGLPLQVPFRPLLPATRFPGGRLMTRPAAATGASAGASAAAQAAE